MTRLGNGGVGLADTVLGWQWSNTFGRWSALVTFPNSWHGFTYPAPPRALDADPNRATAIQQTKERTVAREHTPEAYEQQGLF